MPEKLTDNGPPLVDESVPPPLFVDEPPPIHHREMDVSQTITSNIYHVGNRVRHPQYGVGVILKILPMAEQIILNVTFDQVGKRLFGSIPVFFDPGSG